MANKLTSKAKQILDSVKTKIKKEEEKILNEDEALLLQLEKLNKRLRLLTSIRYNFLKSLIQGIGTTIGATIIAGIIILFLNRAIKSVQDIPILNNIIQSLTLENVIENQTAP